METIQDKIIVPLHKPGYAGKSSLLLWADVSTFLIYMQPLNGLRNRRGKYFAKREAIDNPLERSDSGANKKKMKEFC